MSAIIVGRAPETRRSFRAHCSLRDRCGLSASVRRPLAALTRWPNSIVAADAPISRRFTTGAGSASELSVEPHRVCEPQSGAS